MPFALPDLKRSYGRSGRAGGPPEVRPFLLAGRELERHRPALEAVLRWYAAHAGRRRADCDFDELAGAAGDYRLARCLAACLSSVYAFEPPPFAAVAGEPAVQALAARGIDSPGALRLLLFEQVNAAGGGYAPPQERTQVLGTVAQALALDVATLESLLWLDAEGEQRLVARGAPPTIEALAALYNRRALETLLVRALSADLVLPSPDGATIRRLYFLAKRNGLLCELALLDAARGPAAGVSVHLYGPLELFGPRTRHGDRFARLLVSLLRGFPGLSGTARVLINEREYQLLLDRRVAEAIARAPEPAAANGEQAPEVDDRAASPPAAGAEAARLAEPQFDSDVEARLYTTLRGMERRHDTAGWRVEREPEPLLHDGLVVVPDFVCQRDEGAGQPPTRVYVEVIGFWTLAYRERKRRQLAALAGRVPLVLVVQEQYAAEFEPLGLPVLRYKQRVPAGDLIRLLNRHFDRADHRHERARRAAHALPAMLRPELGMVPESTLRAQLGLTEADDVAAILTESLTDTEGQRQWRVIGGIGLCHSDWLGALGEVCAAVVDLAAGAAPLEQVRQAVAGAALPQAELAAHHLEALLPGAGFEVVWESLFAAEVRRAEPLPAQPPAPS